MCFHFPVMPRLFMATRMEDRYPIVDILQQTPPIPSNCQWAMFLRNHDELTLEMVTDEERDYMYRVYAEDRQMRINLGIRRRLAPLLGNDRRRIELMNALLFSLPGTPVIYYGDEIGMGDNIYLGDRNGVRTPMQWTGDRNAGFSTANPQKLFLPITNAPEYHYETLNVEAQQNNPNSLLWWMKRLIEHRKEYQAFSRGTIEFLLPKNRKIVAFFRRYEEQTVLVVANLSRFPQYAELDLSAFKGATPVEMFGRVEFPSVGDGPYVITLAGHGFYWFSLTPKSGIEESSEIEGGKLEIPEIGIESWARLTEDRTVSAFTALLPEFLLTRRWYRSKDRTVQDLDVLDVIPITGTESYIVIVQIDYTEGDPENYLLPVAAARGAEAVQAEARFADTIVARVKTADGDTGVLYGALWNRAFCDAVINAIGRRRRFRGRRGELAGSHTRAFRKTWGAAHPSLDPSVLNAHQSNSSVVYSDRFILKMFRKVEPGINPDLEIGTFLTERGFKHTPALAGHIEYRVDQGEPIHAGILHAFVPNQGDAWNYTLDSLSRFFEAALASTGKARALAVKSHHPMDLMSEEMPAEAHELLGTYVQSAHLLGERTAQMHAALADADGNPDFTPEPFTDHYRQGLYHGLVSYANRSLELLHNRASSLSGSAAEDARRVVALEERIRKRFRPLRDHRITAMRIRQHGDFHLGQILYTGKDFVIIDFEGEARLSLSERRLKRSAMRDVASMIRSFQYAAYAALFGKIAGITARPELIPLLESWAAFWNAWATAIYLKGYFGVAGNLPFVPSDAADRRLLLDVFLVDKALHEVTYDLMNRPDWVRIPLRGILNLIG
jgi:maltose alpha-D-glucosyltransferase / alpha-amylase